jgi:hypothetical protein
MTMEKISFEVNGSDVVIKPDDYRNVRVEIDGVELSDLIEEIDDDDSILEVIGTDSVATWISNNNKMIDVLDELVTQEIAEYLESRGWKVHWIE